MKVPVFLMADYANRGQAGKVNMLGVFNSIQAKGFPARHRTLYLVIRVEAELGEFDAPHEMKILFFDEDANELGAQEGKLVIPHPPSGVTAYADLIMEIADLILERPGRYEFRLVINNETKGIIPLTVVQQLPSEHTG